MKFLKLNLALFLLLISGQIFAKNYGHEMPYHVLATYTKFDKHNAYIKNMSKFKYYYLKLKSWDTEKYPALTVEEFSAVNFFYSAQEFEQNWKKFFEYCYEIDYSFYFAHNNDYVCKSRKILDIIFNPEYQNCSKDLFVYVLYEALYDKKSTQLNRKKRSELIGEASQILEKTIRHSGLNNSDSMVKWFKYYIDYTIKKKIATKNWLGTTTTYRYPQDDLKRMKIVTKTWLGTTTKWRGQES